jgi:hypothetical protein
MPNYTKQQIYIISNKAKAQGKSLDDLRKDDKKSKKKMKEKPFINKKNKINLETKESLRDKIRESNRTSILLNKEYDV